MCPCIPSSMLPRLNACIWQNIQLASLCCHREAPIAKVSGASPLWRNHTRADGRFRRTGGAKDFALPRLDHPFKYLTALAGFRISHAQSRYLVAQFSIPIGERWTQLQCTMRYEAQTTPFEEGSQFHGTGHCLERLDIPFLAHYT